MKSSPDLLRGETGVINIGLSSLRDSLLQAGVAVMHVDWRPPTGVDADLNSRLTRLQRHGDCMAAANREAARRLVEATPVWVDVAVAGEVVPALDGRVLLHAGPPVDWERMCGPMRGAVIGAILYEGWAATAEEAGRLAAGGGVTFAPCHEHSAVGPMAGLISPSMPVAVVENRSHGNRAFSTFNEGLGKALRFGAYSADVLERLRWLEVSLAPVLREAVRETGGVNLKSIIARALQMGDEVHNRNVAATSLLVRALAPALARGDCPDVGAVASFLAENDHFFLNLSMAAHKAAADAAADVPWSTVVTAMTRNGTEFGIRVSGLGGRWFTAPAPAVDGLYFPAFSPADANSDMGDSSICETAGLGGFAMAAAPAITRFVGGTVQDALRFTREMYEITVGRNPNFSLPPLDFAGTATGIDVLQVLDTGIAPVINTGIAHREPGVGQVGAGLVRAPMQCFVAAARAFCEQYVG